MDGYGPLRDPKGQRRRLCRVALGKQRQDLSLSVTQELGPRVLVLIILGFGRM